MLARRPSQLRTGGLDFVGLGGCFAGAEAAKVDKVGTALVDLLERCPSRRGGRLGGELSCLSLGVRRRFLSGDRPVS